MQKDFRYGNATSSRTGIMVCRTCHKDINDGEYRYRETDREFINWHRACCEDDPMWKHLDEKKAVLAAEQEQFESDMAALIKKWGEDRVSEFICSAYEY